MYKRRGILSTLIIFIMTLTLLNLTAQYNVYAKAIASPTPVVSGIGTSYMLGDRISLKLTSTGTTINVQYKAILTNETTKKTIDLLKGFTPKYYNPKTSYQLSFIVSEAGKYTISVTSKLGGYKSTYSKTVIKTFNVLSNATIIKSISPIAVRVNIGEKYNLPGMVRAKMKDNSIKDVSIIWDSSVVDTSKLGLYTFYGTVEGYSGKVMLTLNVVDERIVSIDDMQISIDEGQAYSLPQKVTAKLNNGTLEADVKWNKDVVDTNIPGSYKFEGIVSGYDKKVNLSLTVNKVNLKIENVNSTNLREVKVIFNKKLSNLYIRNEYIKLYKGTTLINTNTELLEDGKTVLLTLSTPGISLTNNDVYMLSLEGVRTETLEKIEKTSKEFTARDVEVPKVVGISFLSTKSLEIVFSEPVKNTGIGTVEVRNNNNLIPVRPGYSGYDTDKIIITMTYPYTITAKYDITVKGFRDFAGYENEIKLQQLQYFKDTRQIEVQLKNATQTYAVVEFNKQVTGLVREHFYNTSPACTALGIYKNPQMTEYISSYDAVKKVWVKFYDSSLSSGYPFAESGSKLNLVPKASGYEIKDNWDNTIAAKSFDIRVAIDKKSPEILDLSVDSESSFVVEFDEEVKLNTSNLEIIESTGVKISGVSISSINQAKYRVSLGKSYAGKNLVVSIKDVEDRAVVPNKLLTYAKNITLWT